MPAMGTSLSMSSGEVTDQQIQYYEVRAKGGTGLIITEFTCIDSNLGKGAPNQLCIDDDRFIPGFQRLANAIHNHEAILFVQLHHAGRESNSMLTGGKQIVAPSPVTCQAIGEEPRELSTEEVKDIIRKFIDGAVRCKKSGVDGVELHGAHGYLINQFISPQTNKRTDEYGGSFENRMRFLEEIVVGIKRQCGWEYPVTVRLSVDEFDEGGTDINLSKRVSRYLEKIGVDAIHASAGNYNSMDKIIGTPLYEQGWKVYLAEAIKEVVNIPVIAVDSIREPEFVESVLAEGKADFVAIGRGLIADPDWVMKLREGRYSEIRKCISCLHCTYTNGPVECSVNVRAGKELELNKLQTITEHHHVIIVGGGPGGMEAARTLSFKGYDVTLMERQNKLGGQLNLVTEPVYKKKMKWYVDYLAHEMERLQINVLLNTEATLEILRGMNPDSIILATGGIPRILDVPGNDLSNVMNYVEVKLEKDPWKNKKIAVIGSGMVCYSTSRRLAENSNNVTYIDIPTKSASRISPQTKARLGSRLKNLNVQLIENHEVQRIMEDGLLVKNQGTGEQTKIEVDYVVFALGIESYNPLEESLREVFEHVFVIGDAAGHTSLAEATHGGFKTAYNLEYLVRNKKKSTNKMD